jgi:hypothetical protein
MPWFLAPKPEVVVVLVRTEAPAALTAAVALLE